MPRSSGINGSVFYPRPGRVQAPDKPSRGCLPFQRPSGEEAQEAQEASTAPPFLTLASLMVAPVLCSRACFIEAVEPM